MRLPIGNADAFWRWLFIEDVDRFVVFLYLIGCHTLDLLKYSLYLFIVVFVEFVDSVQLSMI